MWNEMIALIIIAIIIFQYDLIFDSEGGVSIKHTLFITTSCQGSNKTKTKLGFEHQTWLGYCTKNKIQTNKKKELQKLLQKSQQIFW